MENDLMYQVVSLMLPGSDDLSLKTVTVDAQQKQVTLAVSARQASPVCPRCGTALSRVHSHYWRRLADLPWADMTVRLHLQVRKCYCPDPACSQRIFSERLPNVVAPWARRTQRLAAQQRSIGLALGGVPSQRLSTQLDCPASRDTFLRLVRTTPTPDAPTPRYLGVDDWALRKGHTYGSLIIDLERSVVIDVLPDRTAETFAQWLKAHPGVEIISRDRGGSFAQGGATGAPDAVQVADRWHLLGNLGDALTSLFDQHRPAVEHHLRPPTVGSVATPEFSGPSLSSSTSTLSPDPAGPGGAPAELAEPPTRPALSRPVSSPLSQRKQEDQARRRAQRQARYEQVRRLHDQGWGLSAIGDQVGLDRNTVRKYVQAPAFPERQPRSPQASVLDPFKPYILQRWNAGCYTGSTILREVRERGYAGSDTIVRNYITQLRNASGLPPKKRKGMQAKEIGDPTQRIPSSRRLTWLVLSQSATLDEIDQQRLAQLRETHADIATAITLAQDFATIVRQRQPARLDNWLERTEQSGIAPLISFVNGIRRDYAAVRAGVTLVYSNGPTEGHVNRLKMLKRQMFGRAKLDLLKVRLMAA